MNPCVICGSTTDVEMHHVRKIRDLKNPSSKLDFFTRQMAAINRKQVPLYRPSSQTSQQHVNGRRKSNIQLRGKEEEQTAE